MVTRPAGARRPGFLLKARYDGSQLGCVQCPTARPEYVKACPAQPASKTAVFIPNVSRSYFAINVHHSSISNR